MATDFKQINRPDWQDRIAGSLHWFLWAACLAAMVLAIIAFACPPAHAGNCGVFYQKQAVVAVPVVAAPVYYQAGRDIEAEALAVKVAKLATAQIVAELRSQLKAGDGTLSQTAPQANVKAFAKCISCHSGPDAKGGVVLDGTAAVDCHTYARWGEIAGLEENVPPAMKNLIKSMKPEEKGAVNEAMLRLGAANRASRQELPPPPEQSGALR